jgi:hypothetical protein
LCDYTSQEAALRSKSGWILSKSAEKIINAARKRLKPAKTSKGKSDFDFDPEVHPKWLAVGEILHEINVKLEVEENNETEEEAEHCCFAKSKTLIFAEDFKTCSTIRDYLSKGRILTLAKIARNCENVKLDIPPEVILHLNSVTRNERVDPSIAVVGASRSNSNKSGGSDDKEMNQTIGPTEVQVTLTQIQRKYDDVQFLQSPVFVVPLRHFEGEAYGISETLEKLRPDNIIIFDPGI